uniref:Uncharacterized protein n=1 Tax=Ditylum brightwellii TaxID=49249 RepID=A0A7S2EDY6_9STRA|mmetsp:Transcript_26400/g.39225  ORF Transcript_26400/g.39225 Transcript_26400/m.39225 type:complete len:245 (+) Transcript_26400:147-881(+)
MTLSKKLPIISSPNKLLKYILNEDWSAVKSRCKKYPREAAVWTKRVGFFKGEHWSCVLPIHQACALCAPKDVIDSLIIAYPKGVQAIESEFKRLPLHIACLNGCLVDVIELLLSYNPLGAQIKDSIGRVPIHYACCNGSDPDVLDCLLSVNPATAKIADKAGWLPIHVACIKGVSMESIRKLLDANPSSVASETAKGSTPLRLISKTNCKNRGEIASLLANLSMERTYANCPAGERRRVVSFAA